jgi:heme oxygenase (mycobilin-producing)
MISVTHFTAADSDFRRHAQDALTALAQCPGFVRGSIGRSTDDTNAWVLVTEWDDIGSYRRALGDSDVKMRATPLLADAVDMPASFETLVAADPGPILIEYKSDHA